MPYGMLDTTLIDFPPNVDVAYIEGLRTRSGMEFPQLLREIDSRLVALNSSISPLVASLLWPTTDVTVDDTGPSAFEVEAGAEYTVTRPQVADIAAHMLPIRDWENSLGLTEEGLEEASQRQVLNNVDGLCAGYRKLYRKRALMRLFSDAEVRVAKKSAYKSPGFAGSGTGDNVFTSPYPDGTALPGGYTHYYRVAAGALATGIMTARDRLKKWHQGPFDLITNATQLALIVAINPGDPVNGFVSAGSALVRGSTTAAEAQVDATVYIGVLFGDIRVHMAIEDFTDPNIAVFKTYGAFNSKNALAWRFDELVGRNAFVKYRAFYPLDLALLKQRFDIGVNSRVAAVLISIEASGNYLAPANWA